MHTAPTQRSITLPSACRNRHVEYGSIFSDSSISAGAHDNTAPVSISTDRTVRRSPGRAGISSSTSTRKLPISSDIMPPEGPPSSSIPLRAESLPSIVRYALLEGVPRVPARTRAQQQEALVRRAPRGIRRRRGRADARADRGDGRAAGAFRARDGRRPQALDVPDLSGHPVFEGQVSL